MWPSVELRKTQLVHHSWSPFWHLFLVDLTLRGAWESPWDHPGSTFASRPQKTTKKSLFGTPFWEVFWIHFSMFLNLFFKRVFQRPLEYMFLIWNTFWHPFWSNIRNFLKMLETLKNEAPPTRKHDFGESEGTDVHNFRHMCQGQFQDPFVFDFSLKLHDSGTPFWHLGDDFLGSFFQV